MSSAQDRLKKLKRSHEDQKQPRKLKAEEKSPTKQSQRDSRIVFNKKFGTSRNGTVDHTSGSDRKAKTRSEATTSSKGVSLRDALKHISNRSTEPARLHKVDKSSRNTFKRRPVENVSTEKILDSLPSRRNVDYKIPKKSGAEPSKVNEHLKEVRTIVENGPEPMELEVTTDTFILNQTCVQSTVVRLVVDTSVLLDTLSNISNLNKKTVRGMTPKILIPWQVLKELDYIKDRSSKLESVQGRARAAINFIHAHLNRENDFLQGQPQSFSNEDLPGFKVEVPDDHLIKCCLQLTNNGHNVVLLSNDKSLCVKARVHNLIAISNSDLSEILSSSDTSVNSYPIETIGGNSSSPAQSVHHITCSLNIFLSSILTNRLTLQHGNMWLWYAPGAPPWSLKTVLELFVRELPSLQTLEVIKKFYETEKSYSALNLDSAQRLGRICHVLASSLSSEYPVEALQLEKQIAFLKCRADFPSGTTYRDECCSLTAYHIQLFEAQLTGFCMRSAMELGIPFQPKNDNYEIPSEWDPRLVAYHFECVSRLSQSLHSISCIPIGQVQLDSPWVQALYSLLVDYLKSRIVFGFAIEDVVEFSNHNTFRNQFPGALEALKLLTEYLNHMKKRLQL